MDNFEKRRQERLLKLKSGGYPTPAPTYKEDKYYDRTDYDWRDKPYPPPQAEIHDLPEQKEPKPKKPRAPQRRITVDQYNTVHDKWTMCKDENKQLYKIIKALEKQIKKLQK